MAFAYGKDQYQLPQPVGWGLSAQIALASTTLRFPLVQGKLNIRLATRSRLGTCLGITEAKRSVFGG